MKDKMTKEEERDGKAEENASREAQKNLGRKPVGRKMTITVTRSKRSSKR